MKLSATLSKGLRVTAVVFGSLILILGAVFGYLYWTIMSGPPHEHSDTIEPGMVQQADTTQAVNPYLPSWEYVPDGEPRVFGDRVYVFGSHDKFNGVSFCENDYVGWSAPVDNLANWRYEGVTYRKAQNPGNADGARKLFAPDVIKGLDGRYYMYFEAEREGMISVAVSDTPAGQYQFYGYVSYPDGTILGKREGDYYQFDPAIFIDDDKRVYLYSGFCPKAIAATIFNFIGKASDRSMAFELAPDMKTVKTSAKSIAPGGLAEQGTSFEGHGFFEASSMRKINSTYYFIYSSYNGHELCYATSNSPMGKFTYQGVIVSNGDIGLPGVTDEKNALAYTGNNHGSLVQIRGIWYIFYHRQTNQSLYSRQGCAEEVRFTSDGRIPQVEMTSGGLNGKPMRGIGKYDARIACHLFSKEGSLPYTLVMLGSAIRKHPYFTQDGPDRQGKPNQYIANMQDGATAGFKYFAFAEANAIAVTTRGTGIGKLIVKDGLRGQVVARVPIHPSQTARTATASLTIDNGKRPLYFTFEGEGAMDFIAFDLMQR